MNMSDAKPIASLSSMLLARKGAARPAMRRPAISGHHGHAAALAQDDLGWNDMGYDVDPDPTAPMDYDHDTGLNPLANAVPEVKPEVKLQQDRIAEQLNVQAESVAALHHPAPKAPVPIIASSVPVGFIERPQVFVSPPVAAPVGAPIISAAKAKAPRAARGLKEKSAFTLRLDSDRHLRLRLACAVSNTSAQQLVTTALDDFINSMPEIGALASRLPTNKPRNAE
jgi:hypothetical protein